MLTHFSHWFRVKAVHWFRVKLVHWFRVKPVAVAEMSEHDTFSKVCALAYSLYKAAI